MITVCCVCERIKAMEQGKEVWLEASIPQDEVPSHGYCPNCAAVARVEIVLLQLKKMQQEQDLPRTAVA